MSLLWSTLTMRSDPSRQAKSAAHKDEIKGEERLEEVEETLR